MEFTFTFTAVLKIQAESEEEAWYKFNTIPSKEIRRDALFIYSTTKLDHFEDSEDE